MLTPRPLLMSIGLLAVGLAATAFAPHAPQEGFIDVYNESSSAIFYLYTSPCEMDTWGGDLLGNDVIASGEYVEITVDPGCWDFAAVTENDEELIHYGLELGDGDEVEITFYDE